MRSSSALTNFNGEDPPAGGRHLVAVDPFSTVADRCVAGILPYQAPPGLGWSSDPRPPLTAERGYIPPPGWASFNYWDEASQCWRDTITLEPWQAL